MRDNKKHRETMKRTGPFHSKLNPHVDQIKAWRRSGKTWQQVTEELAKLGVKTDPASAYRFIKRWRKKPYAYGADQAPEPEKASPPVPSGPAQPARAPEPTPTETIEEEFNRRAKEQQAKKPGLKIVNPKEEL
jgi:hypothetical protein